MSFCIVAGLYARVGNVMSKEEEYRDCALRMVELANKQHVSADKSRLIALAEGWMDLAERAARSPIERLRRLQPKSE